MRARSRCCRSTPTRPRTRPARSCATGRPSTCPPSGGGRQPTVDRPRCGGCAPATSTRRGTRRSRTPASSCPMWPRDYGGLGVKSRVARAVDTELAPPEPRTPERARTQPGGPDDPGLGDRGAKAAVPPADRPQRRGLVPALQRARRGLRPRVARDAGRYATATSGSSPARRSGRRGRTSRSSRC